MLNHDLIPADEFIDLCCKYDAAISGVLKVDRIGGLAYLCEEDADFYRDLWIRLRMMEPAIVETNTKSGFVYLVSAPDSNLYKIGITRDVKNKMRSLSSMCPIQTVLVCTIESRSYRDLESQLHKRFSDKRVRGEWFNLSDADVEYIKGLAE